MPRKKRSELKAGIFIILCLALAVGVVMWLGASDYFRSKGQVVSFYVQQGDGPTVLTVGNPVTYGDAQIGMINDVVADPATGRCIYHARIDRKDLHIFSDGKATVISAMLGGSKLVVLNSGTQGAGMADDQKPIKISGGLDRAMGDIAATAENIRVISDVLRRQVDPAQGGKILASVGCVIDDLKTASDNIVKISGHVLGQTDVSKPDSILARIQKSAVDINAITADAQPKLSRMLGAGADAAENLDKYLKTDVAEFLAKLRESNNELLKIATNFSDVSKEVKELVVMNRDNLDVIIGNMTLVSSNLKAMANEVRRSPWKLLYKPTDKETKQQDIRDAASAFAEGASQLDQTVAKLSGLAKANPGGVASNNPMLQEVLKDLKESFAKFNKVEQTLWNELQKP